MEYKVIPYGFGHQQIVSRANYDVWKDEATVPNDNAERVLTALKLYDTLREQFAFLLPKPEVQEPEEQFVDYVGFDSSWVLKLSYSEKTGTFKLTKTDGDVITHYDVPIRDFVRVLRPGPENSFSVGKAYNSVIKGRYKTTR
jgi:hypothetical protein